MFNKSLIVVILFCAGSFQINEVSASPKTVVRTDIKGRLLTPEEGCGYSKVHHKRIVGGGPAKPGAWPWLAMLGYIDPRTGPFFTCGGSLITSRHVLSATHCLRTKFTIVRLGEHDTTTEEDGKHIDVPIARAEKHEKYTILTRINDIAVILLAQDVEFTDRISPICVPTSKHAINFADSNPFIAGWGTLKEGGALSTVLQEAQVPIVPNADCKKKFEDAGEYVNGRDYRFNDTFVLCAGFAEGGVDACQGDSGGPLMLPVFENGRFPFYQIGVVSYGTGCGRPNLPTVYANVQKYYDYIESQLNRD